MANTKGSAGIKAWISLKNGKTSIARLDFYPNDYSAIPNDFQSGVSTFFRLSFFEKDFGYILDLLRNEGPWKLDFTLDSRITPPLGYTNGKGGYGYIYSGDETVGEDDAP